MSESFGEYLRRERELREISLEEVSARTKIKKSFLTALENDRLEQLPGEAFIRGFIRAYAQEIGLDPNQTLLRFEEFLKSRNELETEAPQNFSFPKWLLGVAGMIIFLALALAFFPRPERMSDFQESKAINSTQKIETNSLQANLLPDKSPETSPFRSPYKITIQANELCWLLATIDESKSREATLYPGESLELEADEKISLLIGNAGGAEIYVNGKKLKPIGEHWQAVRLIIPQELEKYLEKNIAQQEKEE